MPGGRLDRSPTEAGVARPARIAVGQAPRNQSSPCPSRGSGVAASGPSPGAGAGLRQPEGGNPDGQHEGKRDASVEAEAGSTPDESESDLEEDGPVPKGRHPSEDDEQRSGASGSESDMGTDD